MGKEVKGIRSANRQLQNCHGDVKYSIRSGVAEELICVIHGHEQRWGDCLKEWGLVSGRGQKGKIRTTVIV